MRALALAAAMLAAAPAAEAADPARPIALETARQGEDLVIRVIGRAAAPTQAAYALEVSSGATSNNRSVQRGRAALTPDREAVLVNIRLAGAARENWRVELTVKPEGGDPYRIARQGD
jgi:hypothetical protein